MTWLLAFGGTILRFVWRLILWIPRRLHLVKQEKIEAEDRLLSILEKDRSLVERQLERETDQDKILELKQELEELEAKQRACYAKMRDRLLEQVGLPAYSALVASDERVLEPENKAKLTEAVRRLDLLPPLATAEEYFLSGNANYALERYDEALANYDSALELKPDDPNFLSNRGNTYHHLKRYEEALADYNKALQLRPDYPDILNNRGINYLKMGAVYKKPEHYDEALADFDRVLELQPDDPNTLYNLACLFSLMRKPDDAISYLEKAIRLDEKFRQQAARDSDFDNVRDDPRFQKLIEGS